jgi:ABC-2 type transport system permease protein
MSRAAEASRRVLSVARKEVRQLARDPLTAGFVVGVPLLQILLFGYAINDDIRRVRTVLVDDSKSALSRQLAGELEATQTFRLTAAAATVDEARDLLQSGAAQAAVVIPADFARAIYRGRGARVLVLVDATDPIQARAVEAAAVGLEEQANRRLEALLAQAAMAAAGAAPPAQPAQRVRVSVFPAYNPEMRSALFSVPALLGVILTTTMIMMTALSLVRERERGTFEFLIGTPVRRLELMVGKIAPYVAIGVAQIALTLLAGWLLFRVPVRGSLVDLGLASMIFIAANLALGMVISTATRTQLQATQVSFFVFLPSVLLSGFMFPFDAMPAPARWLGELLPLTHYVRLARGILLRGAPLGSQWSEVGALVLFCVLTVAASARLFKKELG